MHPWIRILLLDIRLLSKSKVFYFKLVLLPIAMIFNLGTLFGKSSLPSHSHQEASTGRVGTDSNIVFPVEWVSATNQTVDPMQYEAVAMTVLFSFLTAFELAHSLVRDKLNHTLGRIQSSPLPMIHYVAGKLLGITLAIVVQMVVVMFSSRLFFQVTWGHVPAVLCITALYGLCIGSVVLSCGFWAKDHASISSFSAPVLYGLGFLGGSFFNKDSFPYILKKIQEWTPNGRAIDAFLHVMQGKNWSALFWDMLILAGMAGLLLLMVLLSAGRKVK